MKKFHYLFAGPTAFPVLCAGRELLNALRQWAMLIYYYLIFFSCNLNIVYTKKNRGTAIFGRDF